MLTPQEKFAIVYPVGLLTARPVEDKWGVYAGEECIASGLTLEHAGLFITMLNKVDPARNGRLM